MCVMFCGCRYLGIPQAVIKKRAEINISPENERKKLPHYNSYNTTYTPLEMKPQQQVDWVFCSVVGGSVSGTEIISV